MKKDYIKKNFKKVDHDTFFAYLGHVKTCGINYRSCEDIGFIRYIDTDRFDSLCISHDWRGDDTMLALPGSTFALIMLNYPFNDRYYIAKSLFGEDL